MNGPTVIRHGYVHVRIHVCTCEVFRCSFDSMYVQYGYVCMIHVGENWVQACKTYILRDRDGGMEPEGVHGGSKSLHSHVSCADGLISHFRSVPLLFILELILWT